jgi:multidrug efflux pump subunit AcrA (membrane-fusion protein)
LLAPIDGIVSAVLHREGESVPAGEAVVTISALSADRIIAYVRQPLNFEAKADLPIEVRARSVHRAIGTGKILAVGTQLEPISGQLLPSRPGGGSTIEYGLPIMVSIPPGLKVLPGEIVDLRPVLD